MAEGDEIINDYRHKLVSVCAKHEDTEMHDDTICEQIFFSRMEQTSSSHSSTFTTKYYRTENPFIRQLLANEYLKSLKSDLKKILDQFKPEVIQSIRATCTAQQVLKKDECYLRTIYALELSCSNISRLRYQC